MDWGYDNSTDFSYDYSDDFWIFDEVPSSFNETQYELDFIKNITAEYEAERNASLEEAARIIAEAEAESERILKQAEVDRLKTLKEAKEEAEVIINEAYQSVENIGPSPGGDLVFEQPEVEFALEDNIHSFIGNVWYGINELYIDQLSETEESAWFVTLMLDIKSFYDSLGDELNFWLFTGEQECYLEYFDETDEEIFFFIAENEELCPVYSGQQVTFTSELLETDDPFAVFQMETESGLTVTFSKKIEDVINAVEDEVHFQYEDHISQEEFEELTAGLVDSSLYDDHISPDDFAALTEGLIHPDELNWEEHGQYLDIPDYGGEMPDVDFENFHDGEADHEGADANAKLYFPEFAQEFTIYGLPEQYTIGQIETDTTAFGKFAAITSDAAGFNAHGEVALWFYDMNGNFCLMSAQTKLDKILSFTISDPYAMCGHKTWKTAAVKYSGEDLIQFQGPGGEWFNILTEDELTPDTSDLDWYDQIKAQSSWYVVPAEYDLIDIASDNSLFGDLWYFTKFDNKGTFFLLDMNANYQCLVTLSPEGDNRASVELKDYSNCVYAPITFRGMTAEKEDLTFSFEG